MIAAASVREAEKVIDASGVVELIEQAIAQHQSKPGRPRQLSVRTLLIALLISARRGEMHLTRVGGVLNDFDKRTAKRLGTNRAGGITRRQIEGLFGLIAKVLRAEGVASFDALCDQLLGATVPDEARASSSIAIDGTSIDSWGTRKWRKATKTSKRRTRVSTDPDARWRAKSKDNPWKRPVFGYDLSVAVTAPEIRGTQVPLVATSMRLRAANTEIMDSARGVIAAHTKLIGELGDVLADREYTRRVDGADFILPIRALGGEPIFELYEHQHGMTGTVRGALIIDGHPFSPALPKGLYDIKTPAVNADLKVITAYQDKIKARSIYALVPHGSRRANGSQDYQCPASAGKIRCSLVPSSKGLGVKVPPALAAPKSAAPDSVCSSKFRRFEATEIPWSQRELYGSKDWYFSCARRSRVEGFFGNLKNQATENVQRGSYRVMGLFKTGLLLAFSVAAANIRLVASFRNKNPKAPRQRRGRPRKVGVGAFASIWESEFRSGAPPGEQAA